MNCNCQVSNSSVSYTGLSLPSQNSCLCAANANNTQQNCACCLAPKASLIPAGPVCSSNTSSTQSCSCVNQFVNSTGTNNFQCNCSQVVITQTITNVTSTNKTSNVTTVTQVVNNVTSTVSSSRLLAPQFCSCLNVTNGQKQTSECNCCVQNKLACPTNTTQQQCSCPGFQSAISQ